MTDLRTLTIISLSFLLSSIAACGDDSEPADDPTITPTSSTSSTSTTATTSTSSTSSTTTDPDVGVPDASEDTNVLEDTNLEDTNLEDTNPEDTNPEDTGTEDTSTEDTSTEDTTPDVPTTTLYVSNATPDATGPLPVTTINIPQNSDGAPTPMTVTTPTTPGTYAVVIFQHGFLMANTHYTAMLQHLASHGFVVVAPQMYEPGGLPFGQPTTPEEIALAGQNLSWLPQNLTNFLPPNVTPNHPTTGLSGHSRGSKVIWSLLVEDPTRARAVAGVDPVDGTGGPFGGEQRVIQGPFSFELASLIVGTGLGPIEAGPFQPACAPEGDNHQTFYDASPSPAWHIIASDYGHNDMLDDSPQGCGFECTACPAGPSRQPMRTLTAGALSAFFIHTLQSNPNPPAFLTDPNNPSYGNVVTESR